jgi:hypothetical protein
MQPLRIHIRLSGPMVQKLRNETARTGVTATAIIEAALARYLDPDAAVLLEERLLQRIDQLDLRQGAMERHLAMCLETLGHFIFYWLIRTNPIPDGERDAAHALGQRRYDHFIGQVAGKLGKERGVAAKLNARMLDGQ